MEYKLKRTIDIVPTIDELAMLIWELDATEQSELIDELMCIDLYSNIESQICAVVNELTFTGERFFDLFEWFRENKRGGVNDI